MRILLYSLNYSPELTGIGKYSGEMAQWLAAAGHDVRVITAPPYYPEWQVQKPFSAWKFRTTTDPVEIRLAHDQSDVVRSVKVYRCPLWVPRNPGGLKRLIHLASFAFTSFFALLRQLRWKPQIIMVIEPPLMCSPGTLMLSRLCGAKSWLHIQDYEVDAAFELGILTSGRLKRTVLAVERWIMSKFHRVSTISNKMLEKYHEKGGDPAKASLFPNWTDLSLIYPLTGPTEYHRQLNIDTNTIVALYSGNMGEKQGLDIVLEAAESLKHRNIQFIMCGDGAARQRLYDRYRHLDNVVWLPLQPLDKLNDLLNTADIHLLPQKASATDLVMPSKLSGMMASGKPAVVTAYEYSELAKVVTGRGLVVPPETLKEFVAAIEKLADDEKIRAEFGRSAREYAISYLERDSILRSVEKDMQSLTEC